MADLLSVLEKTQNPAELQNASKYLEEAARGNLPLFLKELSKIVANTDNSNYSRMAACLQIKNCLKSNSANVQQNHHRNWLQIGQQDRIEIKNNAFSALGSEQNRPSTIPQVIAAIAAAELPVQQWNDLIPQLLKNVNGANQKFERTKEASLEAIGYICADVQPELLSGLSNQILNAICIGLHESESSPHVRLAAITAMLNSLEFTKANFDRDTERHHIMQVICQSSVPQKGAPGALDVQIRTRALECLVKIVSLYYKYMDFYMNDVFQLTMESMNCGSDEIALQAIEFWSTVCDEEIDLALEESEAAEQNRAPTDKSSRYATGVLPYICPALTNMLTHQEEDADEEEWNPAKAAGVCLMNLASCCEGDILDHVMGFISQNMEEAAWQKREAAIMAFGSVLEGPPPEKLKPFIDQAMPVIITRLGDQSVAVRDTAAWFVGRACDIVPDAAINENYFERLLQAMVQGLQDQPRVAQNMCWAFTSLSDAAYDQAAGAMTQSDSETPQTYCMSRYYAPIVEKLLETTRRPDANQSNLRNAAYEAVMEMIKNSPEDCYQTVLKTTEEIMKCIQGTFTMQVSQSDRSQFNDLQSLLCATLQAVVRKIKPADIAKIADQCMEAMLKMMNSSPGIGSIQEDALQTIGALIEVIGNDFSRYMGAFNPFLCEALKNHAESSVLIAAVGVVTDICRAMQVQQLNQFFQELMALLYKALRDASVHHTVKPQIISAFGDAALALGPSFVEYLEPVLATITEACQLQVSPDNYEMLDYLVDLRESCLEAFAGIIQGLKGDDNNPQASEVRKLESHLDFIFQFLSLIAVDKDELTDSLLASCVGLIGDISMAFGEFIGQRLLQYCATEQIQYLLQTGLSAKNDKTKRLANWAVKQLKRIQRQANM